MGTQEYLDAIQSDKEQKNLTRIIRKSIGLEDENWELRAEVGQLREQVRVVDIFRRDALDNEYLFRARTSDAETEVERLREALAWAVWNLPTPSVNSDPEYGLHYLEADELVQDPDEECQHRWVESNRPDIVKGSWCANCGIFKP